MHAFTVIHSNCVDLILLSWLIPLSSHFIGKLSWFHTMRDIHQIKFIFISAGLTIYIEFNADGFYL